jgi:hypothetical protein
MRCRGGSRTIALALILLAGSMAFAVAAPGSGEPAFHCKNVHTGEAQINPNPKGLPPLAIGDSTMLLPIPNLNAVGFSVNARGCRGFKEAIEVAAKAKRRGRLPHLILINSYGNGGVNPDLIQEALATIGRKRVLGLITAYNADTGHPPAPDTGELFRARKAYPHRILLLNWVKYSLPHHATEPAPGAWFLPDLFHPNYTGADAYAQFLARALPMAPNGRFP